MSKLLHKADVQQLSAWQRNAIRKSPLSATALARKYGVKVRTIQRIWGSGTALPRI